MEKDTLIVLRRCTPPLFVPNKKVPAAATATAHSAGRHPILSTVRRMQKGLRLFWDIPAADGPKFSKKLPVQQEAEPLPLFYGLPGSDKIYHLYPEFSPY